MSDYRVTLNVAGMELVETAVNLNVYFDLDPGEEIKAWLIDEMVRKCDEDFRGFLEDAIEVEKI